MLKKFSILVLQEFVVVNKQFLKDVDFSKSGLKGYVDYNNILFTLGWYMILSSVDLCL